MSEGSSMIRVGQSPQPPVWVWKMHRDSEPRNAVLPTNRQSGAKSSCKLQVNSQRTLGSSATAAARCHYSSISAIRLQPKVLVPECLKPEKHTAFGDP